MRRLGIAAAVTLALAAAVAAESDSRAQSLGVQTPSVSITAPGVNVDLPSVKVTPPPLPVDPPTVTPPPLPVEPPPLPVEAPPLPVEPPSLPVRPPSLPGERPVPVTPPSTPASPSAPSRPSQPAGSPASSAGSPSPSGSGGAGAAGPSGAILGTAPFPTRSELVRLSPAQRRQLLRVAFDTPLRKQRLRQLRSAMHEHGGCLGMLPNRGRRALELRAGLFGREPASRRVIARRIGTSPARALRLERSSLRRLVTAGERGLCDGGVGAPAAGVGSPEWGAGVPGDESSGGNGGGDSRTRGEGDGGTDPRAANDVLADVQEGGPGLDLGDGDEGAVETLLFLLLTLLALLVAAAIAWQRHAAHGGAATARAGRRPLLFLDVDGVIALSVFSKGLPPGQMRESPLGFIYLPDRTGGLVRKLASRFDIVWATGWEHRANSGLLDPLGLREELPVLTFGKKARADSSEWKIKRVNAHAGGRPAAWLDDHFVDLHERWAARRPEPTLLVRVDPHAGLTPDHVERLLRWADRVEAAQAVAESNGGRRAQAS